MIAIECRDVTVQYGHRVALWGVTCQLPAGRLIAIVGPNGAGKSTLLRAMVGLVRLSRGEIRLFGQAPEKVRRRVSYMPQRETVDWDFPLTVFDVVLMGCYGELRLGARPRREHYERAQRALELVGMERHAQRLLSELSGGQQQRVFLARALAQQAELYLMDEPLAGVDAVTEQVVLHVLEELRRQGKTVVVVHHDLSTIAERFDWVVLLNLRLVACGAVPEVLTMANLHGAYGGRLQMLSDVAQVLEQRRQRLRHG
jgi:manganese/zinc/iron transport system ATP- binding protein